MQVTTDNVGLTGMKFFSITRSLVLTVSINFINDININDDFINMFTVNLIYLFGNFIFLLGCGDNCYLRACSCTIQRCPTGERFELDQCL